MAKMTPVPGCTTNSSANMSAAAGNARRWRMADEAFEVEPEFER